MALMDFRSCEIFCNKIATLQGKKGKRACSQRDYVSVGGHGFDHDTC